jgi:gluconate kinase
MLIMRYGILRRALYIQPPIFIYVCLYIHCLLRVPKNSYIYIFIYKYFVLQTLKQSPMHFMRYRILWSALYIQPPSVNDGVYIYSLLRVPKNSYTYIYLHIYIYLILQTLKQPPIHFMKYRILWRDLYFQPTTANDDSYIYSLLRVPKIHIHIYIFIYIFNFTNA